MVDRLVIGENHRKAYMFTINSLKTISADGKDSDFFHIADEIGKVFVKFSP